MTSNQTALKPDCDICGQPYHRHPEIFGMGRVCPVSAVTYRPRSSDRTAVLEEALETIDLNVSHAKMGDWSLALDEIRRVARAALNRETGQ